MYSSYSLSARFFRRFGWNIESLGVHFQYKGDEVFWLFPWKRTNKHLKFLSISFESTFGCLQELDNMWDLCSGANKQ